MNFGKRYQKIAKRLARIEQPDVSIVESTFLGNRESDFVTISSYQRLTNRHRHFICSSIDQKHQVVDVVEVSFHGEPSDCNVFQRICQESWLSSQTGHPKLETIAGNVPANKSTLFVKGLSLNLFEHTRGQIHCHFSAATIDCSQQKVYLSTSKPSRIYLVSVAGNISGVDYLHASSKIGHESVHIDVTMLTLVGTRAIAFFENQVHASIFQQMVYTLIDKPYPKNGVAELLHYSLASKSRIRTGIVWVDM